MVLALPPGLEGLSLAPPAPEPDNDRDRFLRQYRPYAEKYSKQTGIPASVYLAIGASESNWGKAGSIFGIKGNKPGAQTYDTWEAGPSGQRVPTRASFNTYNNPDEAFNDFHDVLSNDRYKPATDYLQQTGDASGFLRRINDAGYATDPHWADNITSIARGIGGDDPLASHLSTGTTSFQNRIRPPSAGDSGLAFQPRGPTPGDITTGQEQQMVADQQTQPDNLLSRLRRSHGEEPNPESLPGAPTDSGPSLSNSLSFLDRNTRIADIPYADRVKQAVETAGQPLARMGLSALSGGPLADVATKLGAEDLPVVGNVLKARNQAVDVGANVEAQALSSLVPTNVRDAALTVAPFAGEAGDALKGARGAAEGLATRGLEGEVARAPGAAAAVDERLLARWKLTPEGGAMTPAEMYQKAIAQGMTEEDIKALLGPEVGQAAIDAGRGGVDTEAQREATRLTGNDAASHAAKRVYNNQSLDALSWDALEARWRAEQPAIQALMNDGPRTIDGTFDVAKFTPAQQKAHELWSYVEENAPVGLLPKPLVMPEAIGAIPELKPQDLRFTDSIQVLNKDAMKEFADRLGASAGVRGISGAGRPTLSDVGHSTVVHEVAHNIWAALPQRLRERWTSEVHPGKDIWEYANWLDKSNELNPTSYASTNAAEDFAESFAVHRLGARFEGGPGEVVRPLSPARQRFMADVDTWLDRASPTYTKDRAKEAAAQASEGIAGKVKPNVLADEATASDMATAMQRARKPTPGEFDTPEIVAARAEQASVPETHLINTPERDQLRATIAEKLYGAGASRKERVADIVLGPPAAGKSSTMVRPLAEEHGSLVIDADMAKEMLPEFGGGRFAGAVHKESAGIVEDTVLSRATEAGDNIVLPLVGKNAGKIDEIGQYLKQLGYKVNLHLVDLPAEKAAARSVERFYQTGRFVDPDYVAGIDGQPAATYAKLKGKEWVNDYSAVSNDVPRGQSPRPLDSSTNTGSSSRGYGNRGAQTTGTGQAEAQGVTPTETIGGGKTLSASPEGTPATGTTTTGPTEVTTTTARGPASDGTAFPDNWSIDEINRFRLLEQGLEGGPKATKPFVGPADNPNAGQLRLGDQGGQLGISEASPSYEGPRPPEGASLSTQRLNRGLTEPTFQGEGVARDTSAGLFPGPLLEAGPTSGKFAAASMESPEARTALLRSKFDQPTYQGEGASLPPPRNPTVNSQGGFPEFAPKPGQSESLLHRAYREVVSLINAPISLVTYGHEPIFRQGIGFALSHPSTAREALGNLAAVARNPEAVAAINEGLNAKPFVKAALESGWLHEGERPVETIVNRVINKIPGMQNSRESARIYLTTLRKAGYEQEAERLFKAGVTDSAEFKALWDTISDVTGHGLRGKSLAVGGINPVFSPQAMLGRFRGLLDPIAPELGNLKAGGVPNLVGAGARNVAIKNLLAIGGMAVSIEGIAKAAGLDLKWNLLNTPLGKVEVGPSSIDPTAGYGSIIRLGARAVDAAQSGDFGRMRDAVSSFVNGQLGPVAGTAWATLSGQDWQGKDFNLIEQITSNPTKSGSLARQLMVPIAANAIWDAVKANGPLGALIAAPSLGAMGVETNLLKDARDKAAHALGAQDYESAGPVIKSKVDANPDVIAAKGSPSEYQQRKAEVVAPIDNEQKQYEAAFTHNLLSRPLRDWYHDTSTKRQQAAQDLSGQFAQQFANFDKTKYDTALRGYFDLAVKNPDGSLDFDATESARQDYFNKLPADQKQWIDESLQVSRDKQSELRKKYLDYIDAKKQAGYFAIKPDDKDATKKRAALDVAHSELDAQAWYFGGGQGTKSGGSLNSTAAVQQALKLAPDRPVKFAGMDRAVNENAGTLAAWQQYGERAAKYLSGFQVERDRERISGFLYQKKWDDLSSNQQASVTSHIKNGVMDASPDLEAYLAWTGQRDTVSNEALITLRELRTKYGRETGRDAKNPIRIR